MVAKSEFLLIVQPLLYFELQVEKGRAVTLLQAGSHVADRCVRIVSVVLKVSIHRIHADRWACLRKYAKTECYLIKGKRLEICGE